MSKAVITWNLTDFEENQDFKRCIKSKDMAMLLWELKHNSYKTCSRKADESGEDDFHIIFEHISGLFEEFNVDIDDLID
jgi:hypothetical protein